MDNIRATVLSLLDNDSQLDRLNTLSNIMSVVKDYYIQLAQDMDSIPWKTRVINEFVDDIYKFLVLYLDMKHIPLRPMLTEVDGSIQHTIRFKRLAHINVHDLTIVFEKELSSNTLFALIDVDSTVKDITEDEYVKFLEIKEKLVNYPEVLIPMTIDKLESVNQIYMMQKALQV